jgi:CheY-like chemotaxis protein
MVTLLSLANSRSNLIRVLHVDDEPTDLEITRIFLKREGKDNFDIVSVLSAEEALQKLNHEQFDVIISDYKMPGMDGLEFLQTLRKREPYNNHLPFILFTGKGGNEVAQEAFNRGADRYIGKNGGPATRCTELACAIRELVTGRIVKLKRK